MKINIAHVNIQGQNCLICEANSRDGTNHSRTTLLSQLAAAARTSGLRVDKSVLAYSEHGQVKFFGNTDLVNFLANSGLPRWTGTLTV